MLDDVDLSSKPVETPTLDYLKENNILVPQKDYQRDVDGNLVLDENNKPTFIDAEPISSSGSAYSIVEGTMEDHIFEYITADSDGSLTSKYYCIELGFGTSKNIEWKEVFTSKYNSTTVTVQLPNNVTKYYSHTYPYPYPYANSSYKETKTRITSLTSSNATNVIFRNINSTSSGGAIENSTNDSSINITADFVGNFVPPNSNNSTGSSGGAIYNRGVIGDITGNFFRNYAYGSNTGIGGAIDNRGVIGDITGNFIYNYANSTSTSAIGGAIDNNATIGDITGNFIGNYATTPANTSGTSSYNTYSAHGGAIYNSSSSSSSSVATIGDITGDFIGNYASAPFSYVAGGAIYNVSSSSAATIGDITGDFIGNYVSSSAFSANGGAISNRIGGYFNYNSVISKLITIGNITGNFIGNYATSSASSDFIYGGAISNYIGGLSNNPTVTSNTITIGDITGDFIGNYVSSSSSAYGGAISNYIGNPFNPTVNSSNPPVAYNTITIGDITGDFIGNYVSSSSETVYGGAISNYNSVYSNTITIGDITGDFIGNYVSSSSRSAYGGAISNYNTVISNIITIGDITGDFIGNYASGSSGTGGAIYNCGTIGDIIGDFIGNYASGSSSSGTGGAIFNYRTIGNITGDFIGNYASGSYGTGAIHNNGTIGDITGDFIGNYASGFSSGTSRVIYNGGTIGDITGDFIGNYASGSSSGAGGAIYNGNKIGDITGDFIGNYASGSSSGTGGAIYNTGTIGKKDSDGNVIGGIINSNFYNNYVKTVDGTVQGGAIWTRRDLNIIADNGTSTFSGNYVQVGEGEKDYQAIYVEAQVGGYTSNSASSLGLSYSGTIYNTSAVTPTLTFLAKNNGQITLNDKILGNYVSDIDLYCWNYSSEKDSTIGKYVYTYRNLDENYNETSVYKYWSESAKDSTIDKTIYTYHILDADSNETSAHRYWSESAKDSTINKTIYTYHILDADGNEISVHKYWYEMDGNIFSNGIYTYHIIDENGSELNTIKSYNSNFIVALNTPEASPLYGNSNNKVNITGDSTGIINLYNDITNADVNVDTVTVNLANGKMHNYEFNKLTSNANAKYIIDIDLANKTSDKITTTTESSGVVTLDSLRIANEFIAIPDETYKIQILDTQTDALQLALSETVKSQLPQDEYKIGISAEEIVDEIKATTNWNDEYNISEQQTNIYGKMGLATTKTTNDSIGISISRTELGDFIVKESQGDTLALWNNLDTEETKNFNFDSAEDIYVVAQDTPETLALGETKGSEVNINGVLAENGNRSIIDLNRRSGFEVNDATILNANNVTITGGYGEVGSVIIASNPDAIINLTNVNLIQNVSSSENGAAIYSNADVNITTDNATSKITDNYANGENEAIYIANPDKTLTLNIVNNGKLVINDKINGERGYRVDITGDFTGLVVLNDDILNADVTMGNITLDNTNNKVRTMNFDKYTVTGDMNFMADVDLKNAEMDRITAGEYGKHLGNLNVIGMNLLSDAKEDVTNILFADKNLKDNVISSVTEVPHSYQSVIYAPIYKYSVAYDNREDGGYFVFSRAKGSGGNSSDAFNPAVLSSPVSTVAAAQATVNETFKYVFEHADAFTQMSFNDRMAKINANKYALSTDFNHNLGSLCPEHNNQSGWFKPYATFESMNLKNGPKLNAITYGSLAGFDTGFHEHKRGWYSVGTGYIGYTGSQLSYGGVDTTMNGGTLGYTHTMYKGNFWTALTLSTGASVGQSHTMYGKEDFTSLMAGVGSKTGYNFEFNEGKFILQPIMFMSYTFVNTFDYTNAAGVRINAEPAHSIQLNPSVRFIANTKNGWQPYVSVGMVWNVMNENKVMANSVRLPEMSMKPYVEYGVGVQRNWKDRFTAFGQAMLRNGGRNGVALTAGFRWALSKDNHAHDKVEAPKTECKVLKQLIPQQKIIMTDKKNTSITSSKAILKQLM